MKDSTKIQMALGFLLLFATCPVVYTAVYPYRPVEGLEMLCVTAAIGLGVVSLSLYICSKDGSPWLTKAAVVYLIGIAGFEAVSLGASAQLLVIAVGLALGSTLPILLFAWARALCSEKLSNNLIGVGLLCGGGAGLSWAMVALETETRAVVHFTLSVLAIVLLLTAVRKEEPQSDPAAVAETPLGEAFSRMMSIALTPLVGFLLSVHFSSMVALRVIDAVTIAGVDGEQVGFIIAAFAALFVGVAASKGKAPLLTILYRLVTPICIATLLILLIVRDGEAMYEATSLFVVVLVAFLSVLAIAICCTLGGTGEFATALAIGPLLVTYAVAYLITLAFSAATASPPQDLVAVYLGALLIYQLVASWREWKTSSRKPPRDIAEDFRDACGRIGAQANLSRREAEIFVYLARGYSPAYVADALTLSESTVRTHVKNIYRKLGVNSREELLDLMGDKVFATEKPDVA